MGRHMLPRLGIAARPLPDMHGGAELHIVESHNVFPTGAASESLEDEWRAVTLLLNLSGDEEDRTAFRGLEHAFPFARGRVQVVPLDDGFGGLRNALAPLAADASWVNVIIFERPSAGAPAERVAALAAALQDLLQYKLSIGMAVSTGKAPRAGLDGAVRQVRGASATTSATAASLFMMFACQMAPDTFNCVDSCDLDPLWESGPEPAVLAEAVWLREAEQLGFASETDLQIVRRAESLFAVPLASKLRGHEQRQMINALRAEMSQPDSLLYFVPMDALATTQVHARFALMPILCAGSALKESR